MYIRSLKSYLHALCNTFLMGIYGFWSYSLSWLYAGHMPQIINALAFYIAYPSPSHTASCLMPSPLPVFLPYRWPESCTVVLCARPETAAWPYYQSLHLTARYSYQMQLPALDCVTSVTCLLYFWVITKLLCGFQPINNNYLKNSGG